MACAQCGRTDDLSIDHVIPRRLLATTNVEKDIGRRLWKRLKQEGYPVGYAVLCRACNSSKSSRGAHPRDEHGRPMQLVWHREHDMRRRTYVYTPAWLRPGENGYNQKEAEVQAAARVRSMATSKTNDEYRAQVSELKRLFETDAGVRIPLYGSARRREHQPGWLWLLREFYNENPDGLNTALEPFKDELRRRKQFNIDGWVYFPYLVTKLAESDPRWKERLWQFIAGRYSLPPYVLRRS
jgi:hypothetical protein